MAFRYGTRSKIPLIWNHFQNRAHWASGRHIYDYMVVSQKDCADCTQFSAITKGTKENSSTLLAIHYPLDQRTLQQSCRTQYFLTCKSRGKKKSKRNLIDTSNLLCLKLFCAHWTKARAMLTSKQKPLWPIEKRGTNISVDSIPWARLLGLEASFRQRKNLRGFSFSKFNHAFYALCIRNVFAKIINFIGDTAHIQGHTIKVLFESNFFFPNKYVNMPSWTTSASSSSSSLACHMNIEKALTVP